MSVDVESPKEQRHNGTAVMQLCSEPESARGRNIAVVTWRKRQSDGIGGIGGIEEWRNQGHAKQMCTTVNASRSTSLIAAGLGR
jgi:hypothetical protein